MSPPKLRTHRSAATAALVGAGLGGGASDRIFQGEAPGSGTVTPYAVVYGGPAVTFDGTVTDPLGDVTYPAQANCVGATVDEAEALADEVLRVWSNPASWSITGRAVSTPTDVIYRNAVRDPASDQSADVPLYFAVVIVGVPTSPAP